MITWTRIWISEGTLRGSIPIQGSSLVAGRVGRQVGCSLSLHLQVLEFIDAMDVFSIESVLQGCNLYSLFSGARHPNSVWDKTYHERVLSNGKQLW